MFVPTPTWAIQGHTQRLLMRYFPRLAMAFAGALNGFFQHWHIYHHRVWASILQANGWKVEAVHGLGGKRSEFLFRLFLPPGLLAFIVKGVTGYYPNRILRYLPRALLGPCHLHRAPCDGISDRRSRGRDRLRTRHRGARG